MYHNPEPNATGGEHAGQSSEQAQPMFQKSKAAMVGHMSKSTCPLPAFSATLQVKEADSGIFIRK